MTNAEAITMLKRMQEPEAWEPQITEEAFEALDIAIAALTATSLDELPNQEEITCLSELRASYSCFDEKEEPFYRALSKGIEALRKSLDPVDLMCNKQKADDSFLKSDPDSVSKGDVIYRQAALNTVRENTFRLTVAEEQGCEGHVAWSADVVYRDVIEGELLELPPAQPVDKAYLCDWYVNSVTGSKPIWTEAHISELMGDFYIIPKRGEQDETD